MTNPVVDRARDLIDALGVLAKHRTAEPAAYRAVHLAATEAISALHQDMLDPRSTRDFDAAALAHTDLARRLRDLPRPMTGQTPRTSAMDPLRDLLGQGRGTAVDTLLGEVASGVLPQVERAVRDGLRDLFSASGSRGGGSSPQDPEPDAPTEDPW